MKSCFSFIVGFCFFANTFAQEPSIEMNDRASLYNNESFQPKHNKYSLLNKDVFYVKDQSIYNTKSDRITQNLLMDSGNAEIIKLVKKAKKNRKREFIAFAAIPFGILAATCIRQNQLSYSWIKPIGVSFLTASLSCIIISPIANHRKTSNYKKAVRLYNLRF
jgi:hypothetical protein